MSIVGRGAVLAGKPHFHFESIKEKMHSLSLKRGVPDTYDPRHDNAFYRVDSLAGGLRAGSRSVRLSNNRIGMTLEFEDRVIFDPSKPNPNWSPKPESPSILRWNDTPGTIRLFDHVQWHAQGNRILLKEWIEKQDRTYFDRAAAFCGSTGKELKVPSEDFTTACEKLGEIETWPYKE